MQITNYFDFKFIINVSISITISLFIVFVLGKGLSDSLSEGISFLLKSLGKKILKKFSPIKFIVGFPEDKISPNHLSYNKHKTVNFGKLNQEFLAAYGTDIFIKAESKFPFLYNGSKIRVQLVDTKDLLGIYSANKLPGKTTTYSFGQIDYENNIVNHIHFDFKPKSLFDKYQIPINIFFQGKLYKENIELTVTKNS